MTKYFLLLVSLIASILVSSLGVFYYANFLQKLKKDVFRILFFLTCIFFCFLLPIFFFQYVFLYLEIQKNSWERVIILAAWILPVLTIGLILKIKGCFNIEREKHKKHELLG